VQEHVRREPVDRREPEEASGNRALAEERERDRLAEIEAREVCTHLVVEPGVRLVRSRRNTEPDRAHRTPGCWQALDCL